MLKGKKETCVYHDFIHLNNYTTVQKFGIRKMYFYSAGMHSKVTVKTFMLQKISISIFFF